MVLKQSYYNLYQTQLRRDIQTKVYHKEFLTIHIFGKDYFGIIKSKKIWPIRIARYQIMGVQLPDDEEFVKSELQKLNETYWSQWGNISFQFGFINEIISFENCWVREWEFTESIKQMRLNLREKIAKKYWLKLAFRENMPQSNIIYDITKTDEQLIEEMNSGAKEKIKKGIKKEIAFRIAEVSEYETFYEKRSKVAHGKGFNPVSKKQFFDLMYYLTETGKWKIFITELDGEIVSGNICLFDDWHLIYLYGFAQRWNNNTWGQQYLKFKIFQRARENGYFYLDMLWWAPTGFPEHPLTSVSQFKESLGWSKIELYGNFDLVLNSFLYKIFKKYYEMRHK